MPEVVSADRDSAHSAIGGFLSSLGISYSVDNTLDSGGNVIDYYLYGNVSEDSFSYRTYGKLMWFVKTSGSSQEFGYCDDIYFYNEYDEFGDFLGRKVSISGAVKVWSFSLPSDIIYSYNVGGFGFYHGRIILSDNGCPYWLDMGVVLAGGGFYDGSVLATQKLRWANWDGISDIDAYWGSLNDYEVVNINGSYYFKIPGYNALLLGDGSEGVEVTPTVVVIAEEDATVYYLAGSELMEDATVWYLLNIQIALTEEEILANSEEVDELIAELIEQYAYKFPNIGLAVNERTKRVVSKMILG